MKTTDTQEYAGDLSDDDIAASLGFMTTLSEQALFPSEELPEKSQVSEEVIQGESVESGVEPDLETNDKDVEQDKEIAEIRTELERLLAEENGKETENTKPTS